MVTTINADAWSIAKFKQAKQIVIYQQLLTQIQLSTALQKLIRYRTACAYSYILRVATNLIAKERNKLEIFSSSIRAIGGAIYR